MSAHLEPLTPDEYVVFREWAIHDYATENVRAGDWSDAEATRRSQEDIDQLLPEGERTKGHHLYSIVAEPGNRRVGVVWFSTEGSGSPGVGFVYNLVVYENYRRKGYAYQAMRDMENIALKEGITRVGLHVFEHNGPAIALYRKLGYVTTSINMAKALKP